MSFLSLPLIRPFAPLKGRLRQRRGISVYDEFWVRS
jgi:hypothetical protein